jgi:hypothetical protein
MHTRAFADTGGGRGGGARKRGGAHGHATRGTVEGRTCTRGPGPQQGCLPPPPQQPRLPPQPPLVLPGSINSASGQSLSLWAPWRARDCATWGCWPSLPGRGSVLAPPGAGEPAMQGNRRAPPRPGNRDSVPAVQGDGPRWIRFGPRGRLWRHRAGARRGGVFSPQPGFSPTRSRAPRP